jgi:hypothetical protein
MEKYNKAYEVKVNKDKFLIWKYSLFLESYNNFSIEVIDLEKSLFL